MTGYFFRRLMVTVIAAQVGLAGAAFAHHGHSRWGDFAMTLEGGSAGLNFQKRLAQPDESLEHCMRCRQYLEFGFEWDEFEDEEGVDRDSTGFTIGYRYYLLTGDMHRKKDGYPKKREGLAIYIAGGIGRYDVDTIDSDLGYYAKAALEIPLTQSTRKDGSLKKAWWSLTGGVRYDQVDVGGQSLDNTGVRIGIRVVMPSRLDQARAAYGQALKEQEDKAYETPSEYEGGGTDGDGR
jgi:hypothetical protein